MGNIKDMKVKVRANKEKRHGKGIDTEKGQEDSEGQGGSRQTADREAEAVHGGKGRGRSNQA